MRNIPQEEALSLLRSLYVGNISAMKAKDSSKAYYEFMKDCIENSDYIQGVSFRAVKAAKELAGEKTRVVYLTPQAKLSTG